MVIMPPRREGGVRHTDGLWRVSRVVGPRSSVMHVVVEEETLVRVGFCEIG